MDDELVIGGKYRHFKGGHYTVIGLAKHSDTLEKMVIYQSMNNGEVWVRNFNEFMSDVDKNKYPNIKQQKRFQLI